MIKFILSMFFALVAFIAVGVMVEFKMGVLAGIMVFWVVFALSVWLSENIDIGYTHVDNKGDYNNCRGLDEISSGRIMSREDDLLASTDLIVERIREDPDFKRAFADKIIQVMMEDKDMMRSMIEPMMEDEDIMRSMIEPMMEDEDMMRSMIEPMMDDEYMMRDLVKEMLDNRRLWGKHY